VDEDHRRSRTGGDVTDPGVAYPDEVRRELRSGGEARVVCNRCRAARSAERYQQGDTPATADHARLRNATRASVMRSGWELHRAVICSPVPAAVRSWESSITSSVGVAAATVPFAMTPSSSPPQGRASRLP